MTLLTLFPSTVFNLPMTLKSFEPLITFKPVLSCKKTFLSWCSDNKLMLNLNKCHFMTNNSIIKYKLQYVALTWFPNYDIYVDRLKYVPRRFLKYLSFKLDEIYPLRRLDHNLLL